MNSSSLTIPVSFFGMAVGTLAWGHAWREAATLWHLPQDVVQITSGIGLIIWVFLLLIYGYKWLVYQADARRELSQPMSSIMSTLVMQRAVTQTSLLPATRPIQGIQIAPPVVAGLSYLALTEGPPDLFIQMLFGYGLYQALLAYRLLHWTCEGGFSAMFWAFSFGAMALTTMSLKLADRAPYVMLWTWLSIVLFVLANAIIALLFWQTYLLARQRRLLVHVDS